jgi:hypothetical protein
MRIRRDLKTIIFNTWKVSKTIINCILISNGIQAQGLLNKSESNFTRQDSLRGVTKERVGDVYHLDIKVNPV